MSNFVFVLDTNLQPLNPIPPGQARRLLNLQEAAVYRRYPFTIILKYAIPNPEIEPHQLKIDPGSKVSGVENALIAVRKTYLLKLSIFNQNQREEAIEFLISP